MTRNPHEPQHGDRWTTRALIVATNDWPAPTWPPAMLYDGRPLAPDEERRFRDEFIKAWSKR